LNNTLIEEFLQAKGETQGADIANATKIEKIANDKYRITFVCKNLVPIEPIECNSELLEIMIADLYRLNTY